MIKNLIEKFELDNRDLHTHQFLVAKVDNEVLGFGRIRKHISCSELCSLGVTQPMRLQGIGKELVKQLILKAEQSLYLVCIIPDFFKPLGFVTVTEYPNELQEKLNYCTSELIVPEKYMVMNYRRRQESK